MTKFLRIIVCGLFVLVLTNGVVMCFVTFAVKPAEYNNSVYTKDQVAEIALMERSAGVSLVYDTNRFNLHFVYGPMIFLIFAYAVLQFIEHKWKDRVSSSCSKIE